MDEGHLENRVKAIIVAKLGVDETEVVREKAFIDDLGADSLDIVELLMSLEEEFDVRIPDEKAESMRTVGDVIAYLLQHQQQA